MIDDDDDGGDYDDNDGNNGNPSFKFNLNYYYKPL